MDSSLFAVLWQLLHFYAFYLPKDALQKERIVDFAKFVEFFVALVPCSGCAYHAARYFLEHVQTLTACTTGQQLFEWTVTFHNYVNNTRMRREFSFVEAESALWMHFTGKSDEQDKIEDAHTYEQAKIRKWKHRLLLLQNKSHQIETQTADPRLTQMFAKKNNNHFEIETSLESYEFLFRGFFLIVMEYNFDRPLETRLAQHTHDLLRLGMQFFPHAKLALDSVAFYKQQKPHFVNGPDMFNYVRLWYNDVMGKNKTSDEMVQDMRTWAQHVTKRQATLYSTLERDRTTIKSLQSEYDTLLRQKQLQDASGAHPVLKNTNKPSTTTIVLSSVALVLLILLIVFIGLYATDKKNKKTSSVTF